jgi:hypothetical protein
LELASSFYAFAAGTAERVAGLELNGANNGDVLTYNITSGQWEPMPPSNTDNQQLSVSSTGDTLRLQNGGFVIIPGISAANTNGGSGSGGNLINISALRAAFGGTIPANSKINAYVISDRTTSNIVGQNMVVMDATAGITVRFTSTHSFNEGDQVEIPLGGATLSDFNGLLQLEGILSDSITVISSGNAVPPTTVL